MVSKIDKIIVLTYVNSKDIDGFIERYSKKLNEIEGIEIHEMYKVYGEYDILTVIDYSSIKLPEALRRLGEVERYFKGEAIFKTLYVTGYGDKESSKNKSRDLDSIIR